MKVIKSILIWACLAFASAGVPEEDFEFKVNQQVIQEIFKQQKGLSLSDVPGITAIVNEYAAKVFEQIQKFAIKYKLDPLDLDNVTEDFLLARITLDNGAIHGISSINRYDDVVVNYKSNTRTLNLLLPIIFSNLSFTYDYNVHFFENIRGDMLGEIKNFKLYLDLEFNFNTLTASINKLKTTNSGEISLTFNGQITDVILNILSQFITTILHPIIQGIIEGIVKFVAQKICNDVNDFLYNITHPNYTQVNEYEQITQFFNNYL